MKKDDPYGDGGGARVGEPETPQRDNMGKGSLGAGKEATGGIAKNGKGKSGSATGTDSTPGKTSGYGGNKGGPKTSSDQR